MLWIDVVDLSFDYNGITVEHQGIYSTIIFRTSREDKGVIFVRMQNRGQAESLVELLNQVIQLVKNQRGFF